MVLRWLTERRHVLVAGLIAILLAGRGITARPLSHDEFYSLHAITDGFDDHMFEVPLLPYYAVLRVWTAWGAVTSDTWLRLLSAISMAVVAMLVAATVRRLASINAGLAAGALMALAPATQVYGQNARAFALGTAVLAASTYFFVRGLHQSSSRWWVAYAIALLIGTALTPFGLVIVVGHAFFMLRAGRPQPDMKRWLLACLAPLPVLAVDAYATLAGYRSSRDWLPRPSIPDFASGLEWLGTGTAAAVGGGVFAGALIVLAMTSRDGARWFGGALAGLTALWFVSQWPASVWAAQYAVALMTLTAIGAGLSLATHQRLSVFAIVLIMALSTIPAFTSIRLVDPREPDMRVAAQAVEAGWQPGDVIEGGGEGSIFGLWSAVHHYATIPDAEQATSPTGRFWTVYGDAPCNPISELPLGGNVALRLCEAPS